MANTEATAAGNSQRQTGHILIVTSGLSGLLYSSLELARRLQTAGHRITYAGPTAVRQLVDHQGLAFLELEPSRLEQFHKDDSTSGWLHRLRLLRQRRSGALRSLTLDGFVGAVGRLDPDLLLIDGEMHEQIIAISPHGVPIVLLNTFSSIWNLPGLPPPHHGVRPGVGWLGSPVAIQALWLALRWRKRCRALVQAIRRMGCDRQSLLRLLARQSGYDLSRETDAHQWLIPFTYRSLPVLSLHALEFEFPHRPPERVHYTGPMMPEARTDHPLTKGSRAKLQVLFERRRRAGDQGRLVYAGFGSVFTTDLDFVRRLIGVVADRPDWDLLISLGEQVEPRELGPLPERVHVFSWVPQLDVLRHCDVVVTHGGINTLDECVLHGVPVLIYCGHETDMAGNTARAIHHGIGIEGDRRRDTTATIGQHLDSLLNDSSYASNVGHLRHQYEQYAEKQMAERIVDSLLDDSRASAPHQGERRDRP